MRVGFKGLMTGVGASAIEQVRSGNGEGQASARPEGLSSAARRYLVTTTLRQLTADSSRLSARMK
jgi:hypothetical protein